jgi:hypothetical protein
MQRADVLACNYLPVVWKQYHRRQSGKTRYVRWSMHYYKLLLPVLLTRTFLSAYNALPSAIMPDWWSECIQTDAIKDSRKFLMYPARQYDQQGDYPSYTYLSHALSFTPVLHMYSHSKSDLGQEYDSRLSMGRQWWIFKYIWSRTVSLPLRGIML